MLTSIFVVVVCLFILQVFRKPLVCVGNSDESYTDGDRVREAPRLADHAGTWFTMKSPLSLN